MLKHKEILSTIEMIDQQHLDIRTVTMGISLLSCCDPDPRRACEKIYEKITRSAENLVKTGEEIEAEFGIPIVNKRISVTPIAMVAAASETGRLLRSGTEGDDRCGSAADPLYPPGLGGDGTGLLLRERGLHPGGNQHGRREPYGPHCEGVRRQNWVPAWAAPSWWFSATPWRTTPLWPGPFTGQGRRSVLSTWGSPAPAWCTMPSSL